MSRMWFPLCSFLRACRRRLFAKETLLCALALSSGSLGVMLNLPVLWRDYDGFGQITAPPGHLTILAFPPLYPFLSRLPVLFVSALSGLAHPHSLEINIKKLSVADREKLEKDLRKLFDQDIADTEAYIEDAAERMRQALRILADGIRGQPDQIAPIARGSDRTPRTPTAID